jgi:GlpG protein
MFWLLDLGGMIERRFGKLHLLLFIIGVAILSNLAQFLWGGIGFGGMSGVVYGLFGFIWIRSKYDPTPDFGIDRNSVIIMIGWLFLCMTGMIGLIGNAAHVSGLLIGMGWAWTTRILK